MPGPVSGCVVHFFVTRQPQRREIRALPRSEGPFFSHALGRGGGVGGVWGGIKLFTCIISVAPNLPEGF